MPHDPRVHDANIIDDGAGHNLALIETREDEVGIGDTRIVNENAEAEAEVMKHAALVLNRAYPGYLLFWKIEADIKNWRGIRISMPCFLPPNWGYFLVGKDLTDKAIRHAGGVLLEMHRLRRSRLDLDEAIEQKNKIKAPFLKKPVET